MDPTARYNRLKEAQQQLVKVQEGLIDLGLKDTGLMTHLTCAISELAQERAEAYKATLPKTKESKP